MTTLRLAQIADNFAALEQLLEESAGEITPEIEAWFAEYDLAEREKVDGYVFYIRALEGQAASLKAVEDELAAKRRTVENRIKHLKERVTAYMQLREVDEVKGEIYRFKLQRNGGKPPLRLASENPLDYPAECRITSVTINKDVVRAAIEQGKILPELAFVDEPGRSLRIY